LIGQQADAQRFTFLSGDRADGQDERQRADDEQ
jgi:hypothetical protein